MDWRSTFALALIQMLAMDSCLATGCSMRDSGDGIWLVGKSYNVSCSCPQAKEDIDLTLRLPPHNLQGTKVDPSTVSALQTRQTEGRLKYQCLYEQKFMTSHDVRVLPELNVKDFDCILNLPQLNCTFSRVEKEVEPSYSLKLNERQPVKCSPGPDNSKMLCTMEAPKYKLEYNLNLVLTIKGREQSQSFNGTASGYKWLEWNLLRKKPETTTNKTCLEWRNPYAHGEELQWEVELLPRNPRIGKPTKMLMDGQIQPDLGLEIFCFPNPPVANQTFDVHLRRRFKPNFRWSEPLNFDISTPPTRPACPPELLANSFSYNAPKRELQIFWVQLSEKDYNGLNLTYFVQTSTGQMATLCGNNSAVFRDWDESRPANVTVRSHNSEGFSEKSSWLAVPQLSQVEKRRPQKLNFEDGKLTWSVPEEQQGLLGYTLFWCTASTISDHLCDDSQPIEHLSLDGAERLWHKFNGSMALTHLFVAGNYSDNASLGGGMNWKLVQHSPDPSGPSSSGVVEGIEAIVALIICGLLLLALIKKLRKMAGIEVELPASISKWVEMEKKAMEMGKNRLGIEMKSMLVDFEEIQESGGSEGCEDSAGPQVPDLPLTVPGNVHPRIVEMPPVTEDISLEPAVEYVSIGYVAVEQAPRILVNPRMAPPSPYVQMDTLSPIGNDGYIRPPMAPPR